MPTVKVTPVTWNDMPIVQCPNCDEEFQRDDYYEAKDGHEFECPKCETALEVISVDTTIVWRVGIKDTTQRTGAE